MAVAERLISRVDDLLRRKFLQNIFLIGLGQLVAVANHGFRPHHIIQHEHALHAGIEGLALQSAGISHDLFGVFGQLYAVAVANGLGEDDVGKAFFLADALRTLAVAGMHWAHQGCSWQRESP